MRISRQFSTTRRESPADAEIASHELLVRAGFIRQHAAGIFSYMPLAKRSLVKIERILREEIDAIGGQELEMPVVNPASLWKETGRWYSTGPELGRFKDRGDRDMVLAMTHEEAVTDLVRREVKSYRQLPMLVYHIQTKWRDDPRPRAGLIRVREFTMKDSYSLDRDEEGLDEQYRDHYQAYFNIFHRCDLPVIAVGADVGMMGGSLAHEFMYLTPAGEDTLILCDSCGYAANRQIATFDKPEPAAEDPEPREEVETPETKTIEALAELLNVPKAKTAKAVFVMATISEDEEDHEQLVLAIVRGDMDLNETKLTNTVGAKSLRPATEAEIEASGAVPGYASPRGLRDTLVVVDDLIPESPNLVAGANREGYHEKNVNYGRDFEADIVTDLAAAEAGYACPDCGEPLSAERGVEVGNIFKLGTRYSASMGATYLDENGEEQPIVMGSYGIGTGRLLACVAEEYRDDEGLMWPITVAPYEVHLLSLRGGEEQAEELYETLRDAGREVLYDDRDESPGVKFADADLVGLPIRVTVSERSLDRGGVEVKRRDEDEVEIVSTDEIVPFLSSLIEELHAEVQARVVEIPFEV
ncbi:MAG: proline--tRNA ligase [Anaerolineales bacterium]|nr:proline--tRNA ligase [Anaerolineales bacterium]